MAQTFGTGVNNDLYMNPNCSLIILQGQDAVMAACANAAKSLLGEMVLMVNKGLPNFQAVWTGSPNIALFLSYLRKTLQAVNGVIAVTSLSTTISNNVLSYSATIKTIYGKGQLNG